MDILYIDYSHKRHMVVHGIMGDLYKKIKTFVCTCIPFYLKEHSLPVMFPLHFNPLHY